MRDAPDTRLTTQGPGRDRRPLAGLAIAALTVALVAGGLALPGCRERPVIRVSGAWALYPLMVRWAEDYQRERPGLRVDVSAGGAGKGVADVLGGLVDIGMVSRDIHPAERERGGVAIAVAKDAVIPTFNAANPHAARLARRGLTRQVLRALFIEGQTLSWGALAGQPEHDERVLVYTRSDACGAAETWAAFLGGKQEQLAGTAVYGDPGLAQAVQKDRLAIGFNNLNYLYDAVTGRPAAGLAALPLDLDGDGQLSAAEDFYAHKERLVAAIARGAYPAPPARDLYLLTRGPPAGATRDFIAWILGDGQRLVGEVGYIALPPERVAGELERLR